MLIYTLAYIIKENNLAKPIQAEPCDPKNTMLVDGLNLAFRWKHQGDPMNMPQDYQSTVASLARSYDCGRVIILADAGSVWRRAKYPEYKGNRRALVEAQTEAEKKESEQFFAYYEETLANIKFPVLRCDGVEADDLAAYIVDHKYELDINTIWLISSDQDWDLLLEEDVHRFSTTKRHEFTLDNWEHPVPPEQYIELKALTGDKSDNIAGVMGLGPVFGARLLDRYGDLFNLLEHRPLPGTANYIKNFNAKPKEEILLEMEIMDLRSCYLDAIGDKLPELEAKLKEIYEA